MSWSLSYLIHTNKIVIIIYNETIFLGLLISFFYSLLILPENEGSKAAINPTIPPLLYNGMVIIPNNKVNAIHIHHWIYMLIAC